MIHKNEAAFPLMTQRPDFILYRRRTKSEWCAAANTLSKNEFGREDVSTGKTGLLSAPGLIKLTREQC